MNTPNIEKVPANIIDTVKKSFRTEEKKITYRGKLAGLLEKGAFPSRDICLYNGDGQMILRGHQTTIRDLVREQRDRQYQEGSLRNAQRTAVFGAVRCEWFENGTSEVCHEATQIWIYQIDHINQYVMENISR